MTSRSGPTKARVYYKRARNALDTWGWLSPLIPVEKFDPKSPRRNCASWKYFLLRKSGFIGKVWNAGYWRTRRGISKSWWSGFKAYFPTHVYEWTVHKFYVWQEITQTAGHSSSEFIHPVPNQIRCVTRSALSILVRKCVAFLEFQVPSAAKTIEANQK